MGKSGNGIILIVFAVLLFLLPSSFQEVFAGMMCTEVYEPVCGIDGVTYSNECKAAVNGVNVAHAGECDSTPPSVQLSSTLPHLIDESGTVLSIVTITFSEDVTGFELGDIEGSQKSPSPGAPIMNGRNFVSVSGSVYKYEQLFHKSQVALIKIPDGVATDLTGNPNTGNSIEIPPSQATGLMVEDDSASLPIEPTLPDDGLKVPELSIPDWIKNTAGWWAERSVDDSDFTGGISYLIEEDIISIPDLPVVTEAAEESVPDWVRNMAGWWADNLTTDQEFADAIKFLVEKGIIQVQT